MRMKHDCRLFAVLCNHILIVLVVILHPLANAQTNVLEAGLRGMSSYKEGSGPGVQAASFPSFTLDGPIDPMKYIVGPGDILSIGIWGAVPTSFPVQVNMEGTVIIPSVGEVDLIGLTLEEAKKLMIQELRKKYVAGEITATLVSPRTFLAYINGQVTSQGSYALKGGSRVSSLIRMSNLSSADSLERGISKRILSRMSQRHIQLTRNGKKTRVDLIRYNATGEDRFNPLLADGDRVDVPKKDDSYFVSIWGAVTSDGIYEYVDGDSLSMFIRFAGGALPSADSSNIEITRLDENGRLAERIRANLGAIEARLAPDVELQRNDRIFVPTQVTLKRDYKIFIDGEVKYRGAFPIARNGSMLSEVLKRVELGEYASSSEGFVIRNVRYESVAELFPYLLMKNFAFSSEDSLYFRLESGLLASSKFVSVDLDKVLAGVTDLEVHDGDFVFIPAKQPPAVYVFGQVNSPGFVPFSKGKDFRYYVEGASGFSQRARKGDAKLIKHKSYAWLDAEDAEIEPGDFIFVTKEIIRPTTFYWAIIKDVILTVGAAASTVATIILISQQ